MPCIMLFLTMSARFCFDLTPSCSFHYDFHYCYYCRLHCSHSNLSPKAVNGLAWLSTSCLISIVIPISIPSDWLTHVRAFAWLSVNLQISTRSQHKIIVFHRCQYGRGIYEHLAPFLSLQFSFLAKCQKELTVAQICIQLLTRVKSYWQCFK